MGKNLTRFAPDAQQAENIQRAAEALVDARRTLALAMVQTNIASYHAAQPDHEDEDESYEEAFSERTFCLVDSDYHLRCISWTEKDKEGTYIVWVYDDEGDTEHKAGVFKGDHLVVCE